MKSKGFYLVKSGNSNEAFELRDFELLELKSDEVLILVDAFGLNYADIMARRGLYRDAPPMPCVLGYEVVGEVQKIGAAVDRKWLGKRVVAFTRFGGYAQHVITKSEALIPIDHSIAYSAALSLATQYLTAYYMVYVAGNVQPGERVLVHAAAGGVGTALIQMLKERKAIVYAKFGSKDKMAYVQSLGADFCIDYSQGDYSETLQALLDGHFIDVSMNAVGGETFKKDMKLLRKGGGRMILYGGSALTQAKWGIFSQLNFLRKMGLFTPVVLMIKSQSILGVNMLRIADNNPPLMRLCVEGVYELYQNGKLNPQEGTEFSASELAQAHDFLESGKSVGKIAVVWK